MKSNFVEIVLGGSPAGSLRSSKFSLNKILDFYVSPSLGDLSDIKKLIIKLPKCIYHEEITCDLNEDVSKLYDLLNKGYTVRVWTSHLAPDSYLLLLLVCNLLKNRIDKLNVVYSDEFNTECYSFGTMTGEEINKSIDYEHTIFKNEIENLSNEWDKIVLKNSDLRIIKNNKVESISYDYFDGEILEFLSNKKTSTILELCYEFSNKYYINDALFIYLVTRLINAGKIVVVEQNERFINTIIKGVNPNE